MGVVINIVLSLTILILALAAPLAALWAVFGYSAETWRRIRRSRWAWLAIVFLFPFVGAISLLVIVGPDLRRASSNPATHSREM